MHDNVRLLPMATCAETHVHACYGISDADQLQRYAETNGKALLCASKACSRHHPVDTYANDSTNDRET